MLLACNKLQDYRHPSQSPGDRLIVARIPVPSPGMAATSEIADHQPLSQCTVHKRENTSKGNISVLQVIFFFLMIKL
ncbi:hypothetical protein XENTR_v10017172 [Xenopus tropicalis]|nr:hypothetical protein XENTR_v10017172 [Xenopus tropicalis]